MRFHNLILLLPAALLASAAPADFHSLADAGHTPPPDSSPPGSLNSTAEEEASAASDVAASSCSDWYKLYGRGRWTYTEVQWCFRQGVQQTVLVQEQRNPWYYWGGAWYTGKSHKLKWRTTGRVGSTRAFDSGEQSNNGPVKKDIYTFKPRIRPGTYPVSVHYRQEGPYWGADAAIDVDLSFVISLGN